MKWQIMKLKNRKTIYLILGILVVVGLLISSYFVIEKVREEKFIKEQTFDSINELQEFPSQETIKKLKTLIESPLLDSYLRERAIFVLTDVSIKLEENSEVRSYLKNLILDKKIPAELHSSVFANINLIDELFPPKKHGIMDTEVWGEIRPGSRITIVVRILSDIDVENAKVIAGKLGKDIEFLPIVPISRPSWWKGSLKANTLKELKFDFLIEKEGEIELPVTYKFDFDQIDYEKETQFLYFKITKTGGEFSRTPILNNDLPRAIIPPQN